MAFDNGKNWHYVKNGEAAGPLPGEELRRLVKDGQVRRETLIWSPGLANWVDAGSYPDLFEGLEPLPPPLPPTAIGVAPAAHGLANAAPMQDTASTAPAGEQSSGLFSGTSYAGGSYSGATAETEVTTYTSVRYAGFWIRFVAYIIDAAILYGLYYLATEFLELTAYPRGFIAGLVPTAVTDNFEALLLQQRVIGIDRADMLTYAAQSSISLALSFIYFVILQAILQATIGKLILGIRLRTSAGNNVGLFRMLWRYLMTFISAAILGIGFLLAAWTREKTALHDMLAGTRVVYRRQR